MMFRPDLGMLTALSLAAPLCLSAEPEEKGQSTARCFPATEFIPVEPTYIPDVPFTLEFRPVSGDWPTTPSAFGWTVGDEPQFLGEQVEEFVLGGESDDFVEIAAIAQGPGFPGECTLWSTGFQPVIVRRFDATPTPVPTVTPTFTPTMTPGTPRPTCTPVPLTTCLDRITSPTRGPGGTVPSSFLIKIESPAEFLFLSGPGGTVDTPEIAPGVFEAKGLTPGSTYLLWWLCDRRSCDPLLDTKGLELNVVETPEETPTPTISPTPSATPSPTTATLTVTPSPTVLTPTPTPVRPLREGWILSEAAKEGERLARISLR